MNPAWWRQLNLRLPWSTHKVRRVPPYEKLAVIYDYIMRHVDYGQWAEYANDLIHSRKPETKYVLDTACGTGNLLQKLKDYPYRLYGCDSSFPMVLQAMRKNHLKGIYIWQSSMSNLAINQFFDVILCLYDSINYIMQPEGIRDFLNEAGKSLTSKGILIFDICTEKNSLDFFHNYHDHEKNENFTYDRWSHYNNKTKLQFTEFKLHFKSDPLTYHEVHQQRIYSVKTIIKLIKSSQLEILEQYDGFSFRNPTSKSNRIHFILQRKD